MPVPAEGVTAASDRPMPMLCLASRLPQFRNICIKTNDRFVGDRSGRLELDLDHESAMSRLGNACTDPIFRCNSEFACGNAIVGGRALQGIEAGDQIITPKGPCSCNSFC